MTQEGFGKSFFCKMEMGSVFLSGEDEIIVIDPMNEYFDIAYTYGGTVVNMSTYTDNYVNPLDMDVWSLDLNDSKGIALSLELFVNGLLNIFNHQTNVDVDNRLTVYGIRDLGTELSSITMLVMMESIQNRIIENGKSGVATWLYIDEFHGTRRSVA